MKASLIPCHPHTRRGLQASAAALVIACAAGCASPRLPQPPSLNLPEPVKDLTAERLGDVVRLHWTTPATTTDHVGIKGAMTAEICRTTVTTPALHAAACTPITRLPVQSGPTNGTDALAPVLTVDPPVLLAYRVQILNAHGRSAGPSPEVFAASGAAPPPLEELRTAPARDGAVLEWKLSDSAAAVELDRLPVGAGGVVIESAARKPSSKRSSQAITKKPEDHMQKPAPTSAPKPLQMTPPASIEIKLRTPTQPTDPGGTIDHTARKNETYRYAAQRVRTVTLAGHVLQIRSNVSSPVTVVMRDTFPPRPPSGLEAIPGGATTTDRSIDLSWTPGTDADLAGYIVYRQEIDSTGVVAGTATRLNATPVVGPAYRDQTAVAGRRYAYRVSAVDTAGNESAPSADVQESLRE